MGLHFRITDPSGETRTFPMPKEKQFRIGRGTGDAILLRDPTLPEEIAEISVTAHANEATQYWIRLFHSAPSLRVGSLCVRESELPLGAALRLGETEIVLEPSADRLSLPSFPPRLRPWYTRSESGMRALWLAKKAAATPLSIYIGGETGTGKEVIAELLHAWSDRSSGPFVPLHCGALAASLAESELFGHLKGSFTGASHQRPGALLQAHGGTLFLDEVGDLSLDLQVKLLRFLENGEIRPVGSDTLRHADVRVICATHLPLRKLVEEGKFRRDLYYRLASVTIDLPTLRSRSEDVELLATKFAADLRKSILPRTLLRLKAYSWPGNVRELRHAVERACGMAGPFQESLDDEAFAFLVNAESIEAAPEIDMGGSVLTLSEMERVMLLKALRLSHGNRTDAARILGIARSTLFEMLKRHRILGPRAEARGRRAELVRQHPKLLA